MINISFIGDISLNNQYLNYYDDNNSPFDGVISKLSESDLVVGNLESIVKGKSGENYLKKPRLFTHIESLEYLNDLNIQIVSLAHNHIYDFFLDGFNLTKDWLEKNKIAYLGAGLNRKAAKEPLIFEKDGIRIGFINYITDDTNPNLPTESKVHLNFFNEEESIQEIIKLREKVDYIVALFHWGGRLEKGRLPDWYQLKLAHNLIDNGVDLIIGHHSHTLQPYEIYKGKYIFYSLGNFCFSDIISDDKYFKVDNKRSGDSAIVEINFGKDDLKVKTSAIFTNPRTMKVLPKKGAGFKGKYQLLFSIVFKHRILWEIYFFQFKAIYPVLYYLRTRGGVMDLLKNINSKKIMRFLKKI